MLSGVRPSPRAECRIRVAAPGRAATKLSGMIYAAERSLST